MILQQSLPVPGLLTVTFLKHRLSLIRQNGQSGLFAYYFLQYKIKVGPLTYESSNTDNAGWHQAIF